MVSKAYEISKILKESEINAEVINNTVRLELSEGVLNLVVEGKLSSGHARALVVIEDEDIQEQKSGMFGKIKKIGTKKKKSSDDVW